jgi:hypothetical protein
MGGCEVKTGEEGEEGAGEDIKDYLLVYLARQYHNGDCEVMM